MIRLLTRAQMVDMSHYEKEENLQLTKELTEYCHARGIITEAEPGRINGGEDGVAVSNSFSIPACCQTSSGTLC